MEVRTAWFSFITKFRNFRSFDCLQIRGHVGANGQHVPQRVALVNELVPGFVCPQQMEVAVEEHQFKSKYAKCLHVTVSIDQ